MSDPRAAKRWMPNRMFDPVSNPFAIQNLLEKEQPPFAAARDERPSSDFGLDALMSGPIVNAFEVDQRLFADEEVMSGATQASAFMPDAVHPGDTFLSETVAASAGFTSEAEQDTDNAAGDIPAADTEAMSPLVADEPVMADTSAASEVSEHATVVAEAGGDTGMAEPDVAEAAVAEPVSMAAEPQDLLSNEAVQQMIEAARAEGYAQGREAGIAEGREAERPEARQQGYDEGFAAGAAQARTEMQSDQRQREQAEHGAKLAQLQTVIDGLQQLAYDADALFEPMKHLSVHLAEQLVRGELAQSPQAISRLVDNALRELNASGDKAVIVHLHPEDLESYRPTVAQFADSLILRPDNMLERGSVRVSLDGSVVEDLMQRRVAGLKRSLAQPAAPGWRAAGGKLSERLADGQRGSTQVEDITLVDKTERVTETAAPADGDD